MKRSKRIGTSVCFLLCGALALLRCPKLRAETTGPLAPDKAAITANLLYKSLTGGVPLLKSNPLYSQIVSKIAVQDYLGAAAAITDPSTGADEFYNNTVADLAQTMNQNGTAVGPRNELSAMFLGLVRDGLPVDSLLTLDFTYLDPTGTPAGVKYAIDDAGCGASTNIPGSFCNTGHYIAVWATTNPRKALQRVNHPSFAGVGIFTSWPWASNYDLAGTGRRNIKGLMENLFLVTMDAMRTNGIPDSAVRQDVPRNDPHYVDNCEQCHDWQDHWVAPFLVKNVVNNALVYQFKDKLNVISGPDYPVSGPTFDFFYSQDQNQILGIDETSLPVQIYSATGIKYIHGQNLNDFAGIISHARGFYRGLVKRIVAQIYMKKLFSVSIFGAADMALLNSQQATIESFTDTLVKTKDLRDAYNRIAVWYAINQ